MAADLSIVVKLVDKAKGPLGALRGTMGKLASVGGKVLKAGMLAGAAGIAAAGFAAFKFGNDFKEAENIIRIGTGASGEALEGLQDDFRRVFESIPTDMDKAASAVADWNTLMGLTGEIGQEAAKRSLEAARLLGEDSAALIQAGGRAFNIFEVAGKDVPGMLDAVFRASQATGVPMTKLLSTVQTYGPVLKNLGFGFIETTALFGSLEKAGIDVSRVMPGINSFMRKLADQGVTDLKGGLFDVIAQIKGATTESEALNLATKAFGAEGAQRLSVAVRTGALDIQDLAAQMGGAQGAILDTAAATETWQEKLKLLRNKVLVKLEPLMVGLVDKVGELADWISDKLVPAMEEWWQKHGPKIIEFFKSVGRKVEDFKRAVVPVFEKVLETLRPLADWFVHNKTAIKAAAVAIGAVLVAMFTAWAISAGAAALATIIAAAPVLALLAAVALLAVGIFLLIENWSSVASFFTDTVPGWFKMLKDKVVGFVEGLWEDITGVINGVVTFLKEHWKEIVTVALSILFPPAGGLFLIITHFGEIKDKVIGIAKDLWNALLGAGGWIVNLAKDIVSTIAGIPGEIADLGVSFGRAAFDLGRDLINGIVSGITTGFFLVRSAINTLIGGAESGINFMILGIDNLGHRLNKIGNVISDVIGFFGGPSLPSIPHISPISLPRLTKGGVVLKTGLAVVHEGERFSRGGASVTVNIGRVGVGVTEKELRDLAVRVSTVFEQEMA